MTLSTSFSWQTHQGRSLKFLEKDQTSKLGQKFLTKFLQLQIKIRHPKLGQNFCDLNPRSDVQTGAKFFVKNFAISIPDQTTKLGQALIGQRWRHH